MNSFKPFSLNLRGKLHFYDRPLVMGIINVTSNSFYAGSRVNDISEIEKRTAEMIEAGADIIDLGGCSSRPGEVAVSESVELEHVVCGMNAIRHVSSEITVSVDTFRSNVARVAVEQCGADIINDISGGDLDENMWSTVARLKVPYVLMHMRGTPATMQSMTQYDDVTSDVVRDLSEKLRKLRLLGVKDVIVDPGFGFSKTTEQNFELMRNLSVMTECLDAPILVGISRKSMITKALGVNTEGALAGTIALNTIALDRGASIIRVHDVSEAASAVRMWQLSN